MWFFNELRAVIIHHEDIFYGRARQWREEKSRENWKQVEKATRSEKRRKESEENIMKKWRFFSDHTRNFHTEYKRSSLSTVCDCCCCCVSDVFSSPSPSSLRHVFFLFSSLRAILRLLTMDIIWTRFEVSFRWLRRVDDDSCCNIISSLEWHERGNQSF